MPMPPVVTITVGEGMLIAGARVPPRHLCCAVLGGVFSCLLKAATRGDRVPAHEEWMSFEGRGSSV